MRKRALGTVLVSLAAWAACLLASSRASAETETPTQGPPDSKALATIPTAPPADTPVPWSARQAAWADGISTALALSNGAIERNPLIGSTPGSLLVVTGAKLGIVEFVERSGMPPEQRGRTLKALSALWGGASINNLFVLLSAQPAVAVLAGVSAGLWIWQKEARPARTPAASDTWLAGGHEPEVPQPWRAVQ